MSLIGSTLSAATAAANAILGDSLAPYALFAQRGRVIGTIAVDVPLREVHEDAYPVTQFPVASGTPIGIHRFYSPTLLEMTVGYSDSTAGYQGYVQTVYQAFLALAASTDVFDVVTGKRQYSNQVIVGLSVITDPASEYALFLTARLQEVIITSTDSGSSSDPQGAQANQAMPSETSPTANIGPQAALPYFASGKLPSGYSPVAATGGVSGLSSFSPSGPVAG